MGKVKDLILAINNSVNSNELATLAGASGLSDIDVGDETIDDVKTKLGSLMSKEAAQNSHEMEEFFKKKLHPTIKGELLGNIDTDLLSQAKSLLGDDEAEKIKEIEFTGEKIKKFTELAQLKLASGSGEDGKKAIDALKNQINEIQNGHASDLQKKDKEFKKLNTDFNNRLIKKEFNSLISGYTLGDKYSEDFIKKALTNDIFDQVQKKAKLTLNNDGVIVPKNPENAELDLYIENQKVENLKGLLDPIMTPFIKKTNQVQPNAYKPAEKTEISRMAQDLIKRRGE